LIQDTGRPGACQCRGHQYLRESLHSKQSNEVLAEGYRFFTCRNLRRYSKLVAHVAAVSTNYRGLPIVGERSGDFVGTGTWPDRLQAKGLRYSPSPTIKLETNYAQKLAFG
jgi:hypothetical protein